MVDYTFHSFKVLVKIPTTHNFQGFFFFFTNFCKLGELVNHWQEDLAKFGYILERKVDFVFFETPIGDMLEPRV